FPLLEGLPENILPLVAYSLSKSFTMYGMRGGALLCMAPTKEIADEFRVVLTYSSRGTWSNCNRASMVALTQIMNDPELKAKVDQERIDTRAILQTRGKIFTDAAAKANLTICPYDSGFFITVPCLNADEVGKELQKDGIFAVPIGKGLRISIASISKEQCDMIPAKMAAAIAKING
ncbi:MAG: aminotransferase class I/II-fold pyridoxal phosphate-dependent enzyme, partial [Firmicutes bacterium]|nr:aminotransferase class I/II-fold pyridoxal phosphate-dependent enzyme [Bacillota bacterium]